MDIITQKSHRASLPSISTDTTTQETMPETFQSPEPEDDSPLRIFVFDTQRTSSQLFSRHLLSHLQLGSISNPYALAATLGPERIQPKLRNNDRAKQAWEDQAASAPARVRSLTYHAATERFLREADRIESQGKLLFVREHAPLVMKHDIILSSIHSRETIVSKQHNPTCLPDELLKAITPIIFIRHPARVIPAWLREANSTANYYQVDDDDLTLWTSARWSRMIFDHFRTIGSSKRPPSRRRQRQRADSVMSPYAADLPIVASTPIVIDAADVVNNTHAILATLCRLLDLNVDGVQDTWGPSQSFQRAYEFLAKTIPENLMKAFSDRLRSSGANGSSSSPAEKSEYHINLDAEQRNWTKEFGAETALALRRKVEEEMPHYEYLKTFKLRVRPSLTEITFKENVFGTPLEHRASIDGPMNTIWSEGERPRETELSEIYRSASLGQLPVGLFVP